MDIPAKIEAILFASGEAVKKNELARLLGISAAETDEALSLLEQALSARGLTLVHKDDAVLLATAPEAGELIEQIRKEELQKDLGKAAVETLSIVLYRGPVAKADIDYIRGVNTSAILRTLLVRGLVERVQHPHVKRKFLYQPTFTLLEYLGVSRTEELPEYASVQEEITSFEQTAANTANESQEMR